MLRAIKTDLLNVRGEPLHAPEWVHAWIQAHRRIVLPDKQTFTRGLVAYDVACHPQDYLLPMLRMTSVLEARGTRLRNVVPLRTSLVPMHVTFDTSTLVRLFYNSGIFDGLAANKSQLFHAAQGRHLEGAVPDRRADLPVARLCV
jgi:hypothetical protein